ncbi:MAG TPA: hypothetical protein VH370_00405 [Humisphaera sp.]|jgi:hypothetical protein|nr:hypothetical protein [Humisphaera sp.]
MKSRIAWSGLLIASLALFPTVTRAQKPNQDEIEQAATTRMKAGLEKHKMEQMALDNDPKVIAAKDKLDQANKDWVALQPQVEEALKSDPDYPKAKEALDTAEKKLTDAKKALAEASATQAKAAEAARKAAEQSRASSSNSGGGGRYGGGGGGARTSTPANNTPKVSPLASQQKAVKDAQDEVNKANAAVNMIRVKVQRGMESRDDWKAAKLAKEKAANEYEASMKPVLAALRNKPEYKAVLKQETDAQAILDQSSSSR